VENPYGTIQQAEVRANGGLVSIEQQRGIAEIQARMLFAYHNPRDPRRSMDAIILECQRPALAEQAEFVYSRGGTDITGATIRLAEVLARGWGHIQCGVKELGRDNGYSECVAYAWDLQSGFLDERSFQVKHWRDTKKGGYPLTDERDISELVLNMGARRKRACILSVIPGDVVDTALEQCRATLATKDTADTSPEALKKMLMRFAEFGVTQKHIEARIQRRLEAIRPAQIAELRRIYNSLKDGMSKPAGWFDEAAAPVGQKGATPTKAPPDSGLTQAEPFEAHLIDHNGEAIGDGKLYTAVGQWIDDYHKQLDEAFPADINLLVENNAATVKFILQHYPGPAQERWLTEDGSRLVTPTERGRQPVQVPTRGQNQRDLVGYVEQIGESLKREVTIPLELHEWTARNKPIYSSMPAATVRGIEERIEDHMKTLEIGQLET
jgi:hypothetical protein